MSKRQTEGRVGNKDPEDNGEPNKGKTGRHGKQRTKRIKMESQGNHSIFTYTQ